MGACREDLIPLAGHLSQTGGQAGITAVPRDSSGPGLPRKRSQCSFSYIHSASSYMLGEKLLHSVAAWPLAAVSSSLLHAHPYTIITAHERAHRI